MVNDYYLENVENVKNVFDETGRVELKRFLTDKEFDELKKELKKLKFTKDELISSHSYSRAKLKIPYSIEKYFSLVTDKQIKFFEAQSFGWKDHIILNDKYVEKEGIDVIFDVTEDWFDNFGGAIHYVDGTGDFTKISVEPNKLLLFKRDKKTHRFVKYVNNLAEKKKRVFLIGRS